MSLRSHRLDTSIHPIGFRQLDPLPSAEELREFYAEFYFQKSAAQYQLEYTDEEKDWFRLDAQVSDYLYSLVFPECGEKKSMFDVGCGEGFIASEFARLGWHVSACDFSSFGVSHFHPGLLASFEQGDIYEILARHIEDRRAFDFVNLANVLEHVLDPVELLRRLKRIISDRGVLRIVVPNDFSDLQNFLIGCNRISGSYWLTPEHINYFNYRSFTKILSATGYKIDYMLADFPIEHFLMHDGSNYKNNPALGRQAHLARVKLDLFYSKNLPAYVQALSAQAQLGMGRDLIAFVR
jgi:2-polyprenyl-3-methyl-5-hydroxy-6-metoxy-1,4-benzoquinol methylase